MEKPTDARFNDLEGRVFGKWTVIEYRGKVATKRGCGPSIWLCRCECGTEKTLQYGNLVNGKTNQCSDCHSKNRSGGNANSYSHGHNSREHGQSITYSSWAAMVARCTNPNQKNYIRYGGRGVRVCSDWRHFPNFLRDMGDKTKGTTVDRMDNDETTKHYSCGKCDECKEHGWVFHCRWATSGEQSRNTRVNFNITHEGETMCLTDWADRKGMGEATLRMRIKKLGWSVHKALTTPVRSKKQG